MYSCNFVYLQDMGTIIFGKLESGKINKGLSLILMPNKVCVTVAIQMIVCVGRPQAWVA